jgi:hypothetical protein
MFAPHFCRFHVAAVLLGFGFLNHAEADCVLHVTKVTDLRFGSMVVVSGGTLTVNPATGFRSGSANVVTPSQINSNVGPAQFRVTGQGTGLVKYSLSLDSPSAINAGTKTMALSAFVTSPGIAAERASILCSAILETIHVGATLQVSPSPTQTQTHGNYASTVPIVLTSKLLPLL